MGLQAVGSRGVAPSTPLIPRGLLENHLLEHESANHELITDVTRHFNSSGAADLQPTQLLAKGGEV